MSAADLLGLIVSALSRSTSSTRCCAGSGSSHAQGWIQIIVFCAVLLAIVPLLGGYMARVFTASACSSPGARAAERSPTGLRVDQRVAGLEGLRRLAARLLGLFWLALYLILRTQTLHPFNPDGFHSGTWDLTFNTASSFVTNTNWQYYGGETTLIDFSQMAGLAVQNFVSAAVGIVVAVALIRGIARAAARRARQLLAGPHARAAATCCCRSRVVGALVLASQGVVQSLGAGARSPRRRSSRSSGPTAAGSSTSTRRCRSRTRTG